jgi:hypothetical protein
MVDHYTKTVLSIIAAALLVLVAQNAVQPSRAQLSTPQKVQICDPVNCASLGVAGRLSNSDIYAWGLVVVPPAQP